MLAKDIKPGVIVVYLGAPCLIEGVHVQSPSARGGATLYKFRGRNLVTKQKTDITLKGTESLDDADFEKRPVSLMYVDAEAVHLLDAADFNQYAVSRADAAEELKYLTEGLEGLYALIYNGECVGLTIPATVTLKITQCDPAIRGNSATSRSKPLLLETGVEVLGPEYLKEGESIKVDTRTGEFLSRA